MRVVFYGGSNSYMAAGYGAALVDELAVTVGRPVERINAAMGNTFSHFGLYQALGGAHRGADVVVVEYAINDNELQRAGGHVTWRRAFEGLVRRIRAEAPDAIVCLLTLYPRNRAAAGVRWVLAERIAAVGARYDVPVIDARDLLADLAGDDPEALYRDLTHYGDAAQEAIGRRVAAIVAALPKPVPGALPEPLWRHGYENARLWTPAGSAALEHRMVTFANSRESVRALRLEEGEGLDFELRGEVVALVTAATTADGVVRLALGDTAATMSAFRRALTEPGAERWSFLVSNLSPGQAVGGTLEARPGAQQMTLELLDRDSVRALGAGAIFCRGTSAMPSPDNAAVLHLIGVLYVGELSEGEHRIGASAPVALAA